MAEPLKNMFNQEFFTSLCDELIVLVPDFDPNLFNKKVYTEHWDKLELKERMYHVTRVVHSFLPEGFENSIPIILKLVKSLKQSKNISFGYMFLADYIEQYGQNNIELSLNAMQEVTQLISCEFAVRPFIIKYPEKLMKQMLIWSTHKHENVRRFSSEGCRPRLPWAVALPELKKDPSPIFPILENLKNDSSEFVRKSVANNLNDITKDNPEIAIDIFKRWYGQAKNTDWIVKHASRTLLKQGNSEMMKLFGFASVADINIVDFEVVKKKIKLGDYLEFSFKLTNRSNNDQKIRLEYAIYYQKANGTLSKKVYMISEKEYEANSITNIVRKQAFKPISTRKFHKGLHQVALVLNGNEGNKIDFSLIL